MTANRYDQAAEAPIMNTYVPINFGELYRIGDTQNWYNLTINRKDVQDAIRCV